jgi:hypothetical protein
MLGQAIFIVEVVSNPLRLLVQWSGIFEAIKQIVVNYGLRVASLWML